MSWIPITVIVGYLGLTTFLGSWLSRRTVGSSGWAIASGNLGLVMVAVGVAGTRIGGVGTYGVAGDVMRTGLWNLWYGVNTFLALALVGIFFAIPYRRLRLQTVGEIFQQRYGTRRSQVLTSLCVQTEYLIVNILEPFVIGSILTAVLGLNFGVSVFIGALVIIAYTSLGGLLGSAVTNMLHCVVIIVGLSALCLVALNHLGGWTEVRSMVDVALTTADPAVDPVSWWSVVGAGWGAVIAMFFSATVHTPAASVYVNFASSAKRERDIVPAFLLGGGIATVMPFLAGFVGLFTLAKYGANSGLRSYQAITQLAVDISPWLGGLALAAVLAAVISSGGPILLASSTMLVRDWLPGAQSWSEERQLRAYRITTVLYGLVAALIAWRGQITSILELLLLGFAMVVPPAVAVGYVIYWRRTSEKACFWGIGLGYAVGLAWYLAIQWADRTGWHAPDDASGLVALFDACFADGGVDPSYVTTVLPLVAIPLLTFALPDHDTPPDRRDDFYSRLARKA